MNEPTADITALLAAHRSGDAGAFDRVVESVYEELRAIGRFQRRRAKPGGDLQTTALVNELYLKLVDQERGWRDRGHFFAACATAMRHILIDAARRQMRVKRGGGNDLPLDEARFLVEGDPEWLLRLDELMRELSERDRRMVRVFECRYFAGYTNAETAEALGLALRTAQRYWDRARAWLKRELREAGLRNRGADGAVSVP